MKKIITIFTTTLFLTALVVSCGKETQSSTQGGGLFKVRVTVTPPLQAGLGGAAGTAYNSFSLTALSAIGGISWQGQFLQSPLISIESQEYSVTKGQNVSLLASLTNLRDSTCRQVKIEGLINNTAFKTVNLELGIKSVNPIVYCKDVQGNSTINFIIP